ncbi:reverse transcriptase domain-containing protein [Saccharopolyspora pogona]|uniref:reverse transcriptase domain-containing protein n=1 Tax=Saccharopolyspora pogona TaxID=333966 RepID=UPI0016870498|nr:reverse transcriptase domain-containing protein [Saccharopolyspora pogona]
MILEPVFEADFKPVSYGFRPNRRAQDAIAEIHLLGSRTHEWVLEVDIKACFDEISHPSLMDRIRKRVGDKRVLSLFKAFLKAGVLSEGDILRDTRVPDSGGHEQQFFSNVRRAATHQVSCDPDAWRPLPPHDIVPDQAF